MKKTILIILGILLIAGVVSGVYLWYKSKKTSPTSALTSQTNLKTYTNEKYSYQLNYPDNVGLAVPGMISPPADSKSDDIVFYEYTKNEILNLYILQNKNNLSFDKFIDSIAKDFSRKEYIDINNQKAIKLYFTKGTIDATKVSLSGVSMLAENESFVFIQKNQNVLMFEIRNTEDKIIAENIVLSFKSLE